MKINEGTLESKEPRLVTMEMQFPMMGEVVYEPSKVDGPESEVLAFELVHQLFTEEMV